MENGNKGVSEKKMYNLRNSDIGGYRMAVCSFSVCVVVFLLFDGVPGGVGKIEVRSSSLCRRVSLLIVVRRMLTGLSFVEVVLRDKYLYKM